MEHICTFQYYDKKGRRLAVFCRYLNYNEAELFTLTCSKEDQFSRKEAHLVYEAYLAGGLQALKDEYKPTIELVLIEPEKREMQTLINYCKSKYYFYISVELPVEVLVNAAELNQI